MTDIVLCSSPESNMTDIVLCSSPESNMADINNVALMRVT